MMKFPTIDFYTKSPFVQKVRDWFARRAPELALGTAARLFVGGLLAGFLAHGWLSPATLCKF